VHVSRYHTSRALVRWSAGRVRRGIRWVPPFRVSVSSIAIEFAINETVSHGATIQAARERLDGMPRTA